MQPPALEITSGRLAGHPILRLVGELDLNAVPDARDAIYRALAEPPRLLILDLRDLAFIDSAGAGVLLGAHRRAAAYGAAVVLLAPQPAVRRILTIAGLDCVLRLCEDEEELLRDCVRSGS